MFKAILVEKGGTGTTVHLADLDEAQLPDADVTVRVGYSTLNYKDALALTGRAPVIRKFPMIPGIDLAGTVEASRAPGFAPGDVVTLNGWGLGETHFGGLAQKARVPAEPLVKVPAPFSARDAAA